MKVLMTIAITLLIHVQITAQTISITDNNICFIGPDIASLNGNDGGNPQRNIYTGTANNGSFPFRIIWSNPNNQWEIQLDTDGNGSYETASHGNTFASAPNPPKNNTGTWSELLGGVCGMINQFEGSGTQTVLPVELTMFEANVLENSIQLNWQTATELNNEKFEIETSEDGHVFRKIGEVKGGGTTLELQNYSFEILNIESGNHYYRLKQIDADGGFEYSAILEITIENTFGSNIKIYPNPAQSELIIESKKMIKNLIIYNSLGQTVQQISSINKDKILVNVNALPKGIYMLQLRQADGQILVKQFVK
jgi:hypothetical protein